MNEKFAALLQQRDTLLQESAALQANPEATVEQITAMTEKVKAVNAAIAARQELAQQEAALPATAAASLPGFVSVRPRAEDDPKRGFTNLGAFALAVKEASRAGGAIDERLKIAAADDGIRIGAAPSNYQQEGHSSEGFQIPPDFRQGIWRPVFENDDLLGLVGPQPTSSNSVQYVRDETTPWGAAGLIAYWTAEGAQYTSSKLATKGGEIKLHKASVLAFATDEVIEDTALMSSRLQEAAPVALSWLISEAIMRGTGVGKPLGWEKASCLVTVAKESGPQTADTVVAKNITKMYSRLLRGPGSRPVWFANADIVPQLIDLKIGNEPSWVGQNSPLASAPNGMLMGIPIRFTEHAATLGDLGDLQLVDLSGYAAYIKSGGTRFDSSIHLYFDYGVEAFRWTVRVGGQPLLSAAVSPANGSNTKSHFVYLEAR